MESKWENLTVGEMDCKTAVWKVLHEVVAMVLLRAVHLELEWDSMASSLDDSSVARLVDSKDMIEVVVMVEYWDG